MIWNKISPSHLQLDIVSLSSNQNDSEQSDLTSEMDLPQLIQTSSLSLSESNYNHTPLLSDQIVGQQEISTSSPSIPFENKVKEMCDASTQTPPLAVNLFDSICQTFDDVIDETTDVICEATDWICDIINDIMKQQSICRTYVPPNHVPSNHVPSNHVPSNHVPSNHVPSNHVPSNHVPSNHVPST